MTDPEKRLLKLYQKCQRFSNVPQLHPQKLTTMSSPWPFSKWGINIVGPLRAQFRIVAIVYFTKWVEAKSMTLITDANFTKFIWYCTDLGSYILWSGTMGGNSTTRGCESSVMAIEFKSSSQSPTISKLTAKLKPSIRHQVCPEEEAR